MPSLPIAARTLAAGVTVVGPVTPGAGLAGMVLVLDVGSLVDPCDFLLEVAFDGSTWQPVATMNVVGPPRNRDGSPAAPPDMHWAASFGDDVNGAVRTTALSAARLTVRNTTAFHTNGGTLTVG